MDCDPFPVNTTTPIFCLLLAQIIQTPMTEPMTPEGNIIPDPAGLRGDWNVADPDRAKSTIVTISHTLTHALCYYPASTGHMERERNHYESLQGPHISERFPNTVLGPGY
ncbi:unnamed protein product [Leuciscus chuanchicus]